MNIKTPALYILAALPVPEVPAVVEVRYSMRSGLRRLEYWTGNKGNRVWARVPQAFHGA